MSDIENNEKKKLSTTLQFYFNPIEQIRMLRYFPFQANFTDETIPINKEPIYTSQKLNICVILNINEDTNPKHLDIQLNSLINLNHLQNKVLIFYFKDDLTYDLNKIIEKYPVERIEQPEKLWVQQGIGDLNIIDCLYQGLEWAKEKKFDILVKLDPELIGKYNWIDDLNELAYQTDGITFNSNGEVWKNFRTECIGFNVKWWTLPPVKFSLVWLLQNACTIELATWLHEMAKILDGRNYSNKKITYLIDNHIDYLHSGYVKWMDLLGNNEKTMDNRHNNVLWKDFSTENEYTI